MRSFKYIITILVGAALFTAVWLEKSELDDAALESFKQNALLEANRVAVRISKAQDEVYRGIRTIARLPGVRNIPLHIQGNDFEPTARRSVQELYNNLAQSVAVSELYIVPVDMQPDEIDSATGKLQEPITTFDHLIIGRHADKEADEDSTDVPEIEIYEYRTMRKQLDRMLAECPTLEQIQGLAYPFYGSEKVVTCDNSAYSISDPDDEDRSGLVFSTPFYGPHGKLKGCISAVILQKAFQAMLPAGAYTLSTTGYGFAISSHTATDDSSHSKKNTSAVEAEPSLSYSVTIPIKSEDKSGNWQLEAVFPSDSFRGPEAAASAQMFLWAGGSAVFLLMLAMLVILRIHDKQRDTLALYNRQLSQEVEHQTEELRRKHADLQAIFSAARDILIISTDLDGEIMTFNDGVLSILHFDCEEDVDLSHIADIFELRRSQDTLREQETETERRRSQFERFEELVALPKKGMSNRKVHTLNLSDGKELSIDLTVSPIYQQQRMDSQISGFLFFGVDVSETRQREQLILEANKTAAEAQSEALKLAQESVQRQRQLEEAMAQVELAEMELRASQQKVEEVTSTIHEAIWSMNAETQSFTYLSDACESMFGFLPGDYINRPDLLENAIHEDDKLSYFEHLDKLGLGQRVDFDFRITDAQGLSKWVRAVASPIEFDGDKAIRFSGSFSDVTQLHETNDALQDSEARMRAILENVADGIITLDQSGAIQLSNPAMTALFEYSADELSGAHITKLISSGTQECPDANSPDFMRKTLELVKTTDDCELEATRKGGQVFPIEIAFSEFRLADKQFYIAVIRDITARIAQQELLAQAEKNTAISALAAGVAHEFKNCLGGIVGNATLAQDYQDEKELVGESLTNIVEISDKANQIALSLLSYAQSGGTGDEVASLQSAVMETQALLEGILTQKQVTLRVDGVEEMSLAIDPANLVQALYNVLLNAVQASDPEETVQLRAFRQNDICMLEVCDNGHGMSEEALKRAFDPFYSNKGVWGDDSSSGQGLGLTSAKNIIEKVGGTIELRSQEGVGSTAEIHLPMHGETAPHEETTKYQAVIDLPGIIVHLFSDASLKDLRKFLDGSAVQWSPASCVEELANSLTSDVGIVFLDGMVPSKIDFAQMFEMLRRERPDIRIVVVVDKTYDYYIADYVKGADYTLQNPISVSSLKRALNLSQQADDLVGAALRSEA